MDNYFTDSLLYEDDIDNGNEAESEDNAPATISIEPIVAYWNDYDSNNPTENEGEWVLNENIVFYYSLCLEDVSVNVKSLHMPLPISKMYSGQ